MKEEVKKAYINLIRSRMEEGMSSLTTRHDIYYRYLVVVDRVSMSEEGNDVLNTIRADSYLTNDLYVGLSILMDWAEGDYELEMSRELEEELWRGITFIANKDPLYLYELEEERREELSRYASKFIGEDLDDLAMS